MIVLSCKQQTVIVDPGQVEAVYFVHENYTPPAPTAIQFKGHGNVIFVDQTPQQIKQAIIDDPGY